MSKSEQVQEVESTGVPQRSKHPERPPSVQCGGKLCCIVSLTGKKKRMEPCQFVFYTWQAVEYEWDDENIIHVPQILCRLSYTATLMPSTHDTLMQHGETALYRLADVAATCGWDDQEFGIDLDIRREGVVDNGEDQFGFFHPEDGAWMDISDAEHMYGVDLDNLDVMQAAGGQYGAKWASEW